MNNKNNDKNKTVETKQKTQKEENMKGKRTRWNTVKKKKNE